MPKAKHPSPAQAPHPLRDEEATLIKEAVQRFFGSDAIVRNFGPDPNRLELHVEMSSENTFTKDECLGVLMRRIARDQILMTVTKRGGRVWGSAKIAYRQGVIV